MSYLFSVHPCDKEDNGGCQHQCEKKGEEAVCKCDKNHKLAADGKTCEIGKSINLIANFA